MLLLRDVVRFSGAMIAETAAVVAVMIAALLEMTIPEASDTHPAALLMLLRTLSPCKAGSRGREAEAAAGSRQP